MKITLNADEIILIHNALVNEKHRLLEKDKAPEDRPLLTEGRLKNIADLEELARHIGTLSNHV